MDPKKVFEKLLDLAGYDTITGSPSYALVRNALERGEPIPEKALPGRLLEKLSPEEREALKKLTPDMIKNYRYPGKQLLPPGA